MDETHIPTKTFKVNVNIPPPFFLNYFNKFIDASIFQNYLKLTNISVNKKDSQNDKRNHQPVSELSNVLENILYQQISV